MVPYYLFVVNMDGSNRFILNAFAALLDCANREPNADQIHALVDQVAGARTGTISEPCPQAPSRTASRTSTPSARNRSNATPAPQVATRGDIDRPPSRAGSHEPRVEERKHRLSLRSSAHPGRCRLLRASREPRAANRREDASSFLGARRGRCRLERAASREPRVEGRATHHLSTRSPSR